MSSPTRDALDDDALRVGTRFVLLSVATWMAVTLLVSWWRRCARFRRLELDIAGPKSLPLIGNALGLLGVNEDNILETLLRMWGGRYGELSRMSVLNNMFVFVTDAKHIEQVCSDRRLQDKPDFYYKSLAMVTGRGLVTANGEMWKAHRTAVTPTFHAKRIEGFVDIFAAEAKGFVERMRPAAGRDAEYTKELRLASAKSIGQTAMPLTEDDTADLKVLVSRHMPRALQIVGVRTVNPWLWPTAIFERTRFGREMADVRRGIYDFVQKSIDQRIDEISRKAAQDKLQGRREGAKSFVDVMLEGQLGQRADYDKAQVLEEVVMVFGASIDTIVTALTYTLKLLSMFPDVQQRVYEEVLEVLGVEDRPISVEDLARLEYTERVLKEAMRLFTPSPLIARHVPVDIELDGKVIPAGSVLIINIFSAHRDPRYYPDPLRFDPDRFLPEKVAERPKGSYLPFSAGPRNCIGKAYAMMQMKTTVAATLRAYKLLPADDGYTHPSQFPVTWNLTLRFVGGAKVRFEPRG